VTAKAVVLLSGGLDSYTAAAVARRDGFALYALSVNYHQRHAHELVAARRVAASLGVERHLEVDIPITYVPARNTIFLSLALGWAEVIGASDLVIGVNAIDYSGYPDCRPEFIRAFEQLASLATRAGVEGRPLTVRTPLINRTKADIIRLGLSLRLDYSLTHSCYDPDPTGAPCRQCDSCRLRAAGFAEAGVIDPLLPSP